MDTEGSEKFLNRRVAKEYSLSGVLLLIILLIFFGKALLPGRVLSPADGIFSTPFFSGYASNEFGSPSNSLLFDQVYQFTPWRYFAWESLRQGELPMWNPLSSAGTPFIATMQSAVFYPINLLLTGIAFDRTFVWSAIARLWIAGASTYLLLRRYRLNRIPSLIGSISFMLSGFLIVWLGHPHVNVAVWLPTVIFLGEVLVTSSTRRELGLAGAALALVIGIQFTGGHIETTVDLLVTFSIYYIARWFQMTRPKMTGQKRDWTKLAVPALAVLLGGAIAAAQMLPFLEWISLSEVLHQRASSNLKLVDPQFVRHVLSLPVVVFPNIFNNPTWDGPYWSYLLRWSNYNELILYVGTATLGLALLSLVAAPKGTSRSLVILWGVIGVLSLGRAFRAPILDLVNQIPPLSLGNPGRLRLITSFSLCIMAAFGTQHLLATNLRDTPRLIRLWIGYCAAVILLGVSILIVSNLAIPIARDQIIAYGRKLVDEEYARRETHSNPLEYYYEEVDRMVSGLENAFKPTNFAMYSSAIWAFLGVVGISILLLSKYNNACWAAIFLLGLVIVDLFSFGRGYNPTIASEDFYPWTSLAAKLAEGPELSRVIALREDLIPDAHMMYGLSDLRGLDFPTRWYSQYLDLIPSRIPWLSYGSIFSSADSSLLRVLNLRYVVTSDTQALRNNDHVTSVQKIGNMYLGEIHGFVPRAFMVYEAEIVETEREALKALKRDPDAVFHRVVIVDEEHDPHPIQESSGASGSIGSVALLSYEANNSAWTVVTDQDGYLFLSDAYYPGWKAYVDGEEAPVRRANGAFRAILVPSGKHIVELKYAPTSVHAGVMVTLISLAIVFGIVIWALKHDPRLPSKFL